MRGQDFERERNPERVLQSMSLKKFARLIFQECPGLAPFAGSLDKIYKAFADYKQVQLCSYSLPCPPSRDHHVYLSAVVRGSPTYWSRPWVQSLWSGSKLAGHIVGAGQQRRNWVYVDTSYQAIGAHAEPCLERGRRASP